MSRLREAVKDMAKTFGVFDWIRTRKARTYDVIRDWGVPLRFVLRKVFPERGQDIDAFSSEFDGLGLLNKIDEGLALERRKDPGFCAGSSSPLNLRALYILCRTLRPNNVVETGVASGASSWTLLAALERNGGGKLHSIDLPPSQWKTEKSTYAEMDHVSLPQQRSPGWLVPGDLRHRWELILGDSETQLGPLLDRLGRIDFFHHDAEHTREAMLREFHEAWPHVGDGGILSSDDVTWNTAFSEFISEVGPAGDSGRWFDFGFMRRTMS